MTWTLVWFKANIGGEDGNDDDLDCGRGCRLVFAVLSSGFLC